MLRSMDGLARSVTCKVLILVNGENRFSCDVDTVNRNRNHVGRANVAREGDVAVEGVFATQGYIVGEGDA